MNARRVAELYRQLAQIYGALADALVEGDAAPPPAPAAPPAPRRRAPRAPRLPTGPVDEAVSARCDKIARERGLLTIGVVGRPKR